MKITRPALHGWYDERRREFRLSLYPADAPVRPSAAISSIEECRAIAERRRAKIIWWPPLPARFEMNNASS